MANMTRIERIEYYRKILAESETSKLALEIIAKDLNSLVWVTSGKRFSKEEKKKLFEEVFQDRDFRRYFPGLESFEPAYGTNDLITEADNSHILEVISALKRTGK
jgi:hypothetical protein